MSDDIRERAAALCKKHAVSFDGKPSATLTAANLRGLAKTALYAAKLAKSNREQGWMPLLQKHYDFLAAADLASKMI